MMIKFTRKNMMGDYVHYSQGIPVPYTNNPINNHTTVSKFAIVKDKESGYYRVGVWDSEFTIYNTNIYADCNSKTLKETITKVSGKYNREQKGV